MIPLKTPLHKAVAFAAGLGLSMLSYPLHAAPASGGDTVQGLYDALLSTMKDGRILGQSGRFTQLEPVIRRSSEFAAILKSQGIDGLIAVLDRKADILTAATAKAS
jgi:ABC-type transporter MlaC component